VEIAPLWDQLALIQFMHDRCDDAIDSSRKAWNAVREFADKEGSPEARGAAATAAVRYASALVGGRHMNDAYEIFGAAISDLEHAASYLQDVNTEAGEYLEKIQTALGEARYYTALCSLATLENPSPEDVDRLTPAMEASLKEVTAKLGDQHPLTACALREHNRMTEAAVEAGRTELAKALYMQEIRLHEAFDKDVEQVAALLYQLGTLYYCAGNHDAAVRSMESALDILGTNDIQDAEDHRLMVQHRLGMALGAAEKHEAARQVLHGIALDLISQLGDGNPASRELDFMMALMGLRDARQSEQRDRDKESALLAEMNAALEDLRTYGNGHMLVRAAEKQVGDIKVLINLQ
jgi:tetratricopeptide (TPR) repeat protein